MNTYFQNWMSHSDKTLADLSTSFINRKLLKSVKFDKKDEDKLYHLQDIVAECGFDPNYYTMVNSNFDLPYDFYRPDSDKPRTQIEILQKDGSLIELSEASPIVASLAGTIHGNSRFYFPKIMLENPEFITFMQTNL